VIFTASVVVRLKPVVNDPQGIVVRDSLRRLGFAGVHDVRVGKHIEISLEAESVEDARSALDVMCERLLRNPVIEDSEVVSVERTDSAVPA
jgi:phosphoribosylformylglycinamidine synthase